MSILSRLRPKKSLPSVLSPKQFAARILENTLRITDTYVKRISADVPGAQNLSYSYLKDHIPNVLEQLAAFIKRHGRDDEYLQSSWLAAEHGLQRAEGQTYTLDDLKKEFRILRHTILEILKDDEKLSDETYRFFVDVYETALANSLEVFLRNSSAELLKHRNEQKQSAERLRTAEVGQAVSASQQRWFEEAMNRLPIPLLFIDMQLKKVTFINLAAQSMLGMIYAGKQPDDVYGTLFDAVDGTGAPLSVEQIPSARTFRGETIRGDEMVLTTPAGIFHLKIFSEQIAQTDEHPASALLLFQDITELKQAESNFRKTQRDLRDAVEIAQVGFWHVDIETQAITVTDLLLKQFGIDPATFKGTLAEAIATIHVDDRERVSAAIQSSIENNTPYRIEYRVVHHDGQIRWIEAKGSLSQDTLGAAPRFTGTSIDVTERVVARTNLEQSATELRTLADSMPQHVWIADSQGLLTYFNKKWFEYSGTRYEDNAGGGWAKAIHPDDLQATIARWQNSLKTGTTYDHEFRLRTADGMYRWHVTRAVPQKSESGEILRWYGTNTDIHDFKTLTEQLGSAKSRLESEQQKFKTIFADASTSMALLQGRDFVYEIANPSYLALFNNRDLIGKPFLEALPELEGQTFPLQAKSVFETGTPYVDPEALAFLKRAPDAPLEERYFDQTYTRVSDEFGKPYGVFIHAREITDLVFARRALEESAERYRIALETADMGTWEMDAQTRLVRWSARTNELFDVERKEGLNFEKVIAKIHPHDRERVRSEIETSFDPHGYGECEISFRVLPEANGVRWLSLLGKTFFVDAPEGRAPTYFIGNVLDITDRVVHEELLREAKDRAERASAAKSQFLANMSHEIRTPLGAIMGFSSLLKDQTLGRDEHDGFISVIERNSVQLLRIIDDILDLSKVEAGMMLIEQIEFSLPEMLTDFSSLMGFKAREKGIGFSSRAATALPMIITSDPTRIRQILMNVVGNAIKFTDQGQVELRCFYKNGLLEFEVEDSGRGISAEQEHNLFQPFTQADTSTTRKYGGTGLGLVLTRSLAEAMGGNFILKKSELGVGSVFSVQLRVSAQPNVEMVTGLGFETVPIRSVASVGQLAGTKVLLVEDSPDNQALISIFLGRAGARTDIASDGEQGYKMALNHNYDIVLMDVQMPVMDGITAIKRLRAEGFRKPVIALTAHAMKEERVRCIAAGFTDFLSKPVTREDLVNTIRRNKG